MVKSASLILALLYAAPAFAADKPGDDLAANAALKYWQAFATLPKSDDKEAPDYTAMPLDDKARALVGAADYALEQMHYGAAIPRCVWAISLDEDGIRTRLPNCQAARTLAGLAVVRMRLRFQDGKTAEAVDDAVDVLTLSRHITTDGTIIAVLVGIAVDQMATNALAAHLPDLDKTALKKLAARLEALPPAESMADAMRRGELRGCLDWFIRQVKAVKNRDQLIDLMAEVSETRDKGKEMLEACGGTAEGVLKYAEQTRPLYEIAARMSDLPPDQFDVEMEKIAKGDAKDNPLFKTLFPAIGKVRRAEARYQARQALLKAAFAVLIDGPDAVKTQRDPFGDGPFEYEPFDGGFELRSKFKAQDKPVSLTVGRRKEK